MATTLSLDPADHGIVDDGRRWWAVQGNVWSSPWRIEASTGRSAAAALKREIFDVETRANGESRRYARMLVRSQEIACVGGPYTTPVAFNLDLRWYLAWEIVNTHASITTASGPIDSLDDCYPWLTEQQVAARIKVVTDRYHRQTPSRDEVPPR